MSAMRSWLARDKARTLRPKKTIGATTTGALGNSGSAVKLHIAVVLGLWFLWQLLLHEALGRILCGGLVGVGQHGADQRQTE